MGKSHSRARARRLLWRWAGPVWLTLCVAACSASGAGVVGGGGESLPSPLAQMLPGLPSGADDRPGRVSAREQDNVHYGSEYWQKASPGADVTDTRMVLHGPSAVSCAWAIYQWSGFVDGLVPNSITVEAGLDSGREYWLALSDYSAGHWRLIGPRDEEYYTHGFDSQTLFSSPNGNVYVAVICDRQNALLVNKLNLKANEDIDPPIAPSGLSVDNIQTRSAHLFWLENPDPDVLGYKLWRGPSGSFMPGDAGVVLVTADIDYLTLEYELDGLEPDTQYYYKLTAFDVAFNESLPSGVCAFKTLINAAPQPGFSWSPAFIQAGREVSFDPAETLDPGDEIEDLSFSWDFDNDGSIDTVTTGPALVPHTYATRGLYECTLTVDDGEFEASLTKDLVVSFKYDFHNVGAADGRPASLNSADTDPASGRIAVGLTDNGPPEVLYYSDEGWDSIPLEDTPGDFLLDVALGPGKLSALTISYEYKFGYADSINWYILEYFGSGWHTVRSGKKGDNVVAHAQLCSASNGRYSFALTSAHSPVPEHEGDVPPVVEPDFSLNWWHEKANGSFATGSVGFGPGDPRPIEALRENSTSYFVYPAAAMHVIEAQDTLSTDLSYHSVPDASSIVLEPGPSGGQVAWLVSTTGGELYWGDNYGAANDPSQHFAPAVTASFVVGLWPVADNEAQFYWTARQADGRTLLRGFDSAGADEYDLGAGYGYAAYGAGGYLVDGSEEGVYIAVQEERDGEIVGYFMADGNLFRKEVLYDPSGIAPALGASAPVIFPDGSLSVLFQQMYPTALRANAGALNLPHTVSLLGNDNFMIPTDACPTGNGREFLTASVSTSQDLILHRCDDASSGDEQILVGDVWHCALERHPDSGEVMLVYTQDGGRELHARTYSGGSWSAPTTVVDGSLYVPRMELAPMAGGGFGLAYLESLGQLKLVEKSGLSWGIPVAVLSNLVNDYGGIGLSYSPDGDCACVVEQAEAPQGVQLGLRPAGSLGFSWEEVEATNGNQAQSCKVYFGDNGPVVFYYNAIWPATGFGIRVLEKYEGNWHGELFDFPFYNVPVGTAVDADGNIVVSGVFGIPAQAVYAVIYR